MTGELRLPKMYRPDRPYRRLGVGIDLPRAFCDDLQAIDPGLYPVFHAYRVLWDNIMNEDSGSLEDPRYTVHMEYGELCMGFVLTDGSGCPLEDGTWHLWRWCFPYGVAHVIKLESRESEYLELVIKRLHLQATWSNKYGFRSYNKLLDQVREEDRTQLMKDREDMFGAIQDENKWLMSRALDNASRGHIQATNPQHESIMSFPGQSNHSRIVRPLDDREGGLYVPE